MVKKCREISQNRFMDTQLTVPRSSGFVCEIQSREQSDRDCIEQTKPDDQGAIAGP